MEFSDIRMITHTHTHTPSWDQVEEFVLVEKALVNISEFHPTTHAIL